MTTRKLHRAVNNGTVALVSDYVYQDMSNRNGDKMPTFTFHEDAEKHPLRVYTGNLVQMAQLIQGCEVVDHGAGFYVPFSNGNEFSDDPAWRDRELAFRTTMDQAVQTFGAHALRILPH